MHAFMKYGRSVNSKKKPRSRLRRRVYPDNHSHALLSGLNDVHVAFAVVLQHPYPTREAYWIHTKMLRKSHLTNNMLSMIVVDTWLKYNEYVRMVGIDKVLHIQAKVSIFQVAIFKNDD